MELNDRYVLGAEQLAGRTKATDRRHGGLVAVERCPAGSPEQHDQLMQRLRRWLELPPHPALPVLRDEFRIGEEHWMISSWVDGQVAAATDEPVDGDDPGHSAVVLARLSAVAEALAQLHQQGDPLVHGVLTPETIIVRPDNRIVLTGLYGVPEPGAGTALYLAPEVRAGQRPTIASDVYGLAAVAWRWLTGLPPDHPMPALLASSRETAVLEHLLRSGLAADPAQRPSTPAALVRRLDHRFRSALPVGTVTFLMTDVCRSTEHWQQDPVAMATAIDRHDRICAETVERFNGVFPRDQGEGDSMLAAFNRASDAVACAAALLRALAQADPASATGRTGPTDQTPPTDQALSPLEVRVAVHTGEATIRNGNYRCIAVNTCARIRALAGDNQVLLSPVTAEIVRAGRPAGTELIDLGEFSLKGLPGRLRVFQLPVPGVAAGRPPTPGPESDPPARPGHPTTALLGRGPELGVLLTALDSALAGRPRTVLVFGGPRIGKTRLATEMAQQAAGHDLRVLWGRNSDSAGTPDYWPWQQVVRSLTEDEDPERVARYLGPDRKDLCAVFGALVAAAEATEAAGAGGPASNLVLMENPELSRPERRFELRQAFMAFLRRATEDRPILILLDDLHWADQQSVLLLEFLTQHLSRARLLIVATFTGLPDPDPGPRPSSGLSSASSGPSSGSDSGRDPGAGAGVDGSLARRVSRIARQSTVDTLVLRNLNLDDIARFVEAATGHRPSVEVIDTVAAVSEGNPFYLNEIVDLLGSEGHLATDGTGPVSLSRGVSTVLRRRLAQLGPDCVRLLAAAAVIGREFPIALAAAASGLCSGAALAALDEALASGLTTAAGDPTGGRYMFSHRLFRQVVDDSLGQTERTRLHLAVAEILEQSVVLDVEQRGRLARHLLAAAPWSDLAKAIRWTRVAAADLASQDAHEDCARLYRTAVDAVRITPGDHGDVQYDLQLSEAEAWWKAGRPDRCTAALRLLSRQNLMVRLPSDDQQTSSTREPTTGSAVATGMSHPQHERSAVQNSAPGPDPKS